MYQLKIETMTCGHCASVVTNTVKLLDPGAMVKINLDTHRVDITSQCALPEITAALADAGYPAQPVK